MSCKVANFKNILIQIASQSYSRHFTLYFPFVLDMNLAAKPFTQLSSVLASTALPHLTGWKYTRPKEPYDQWGRGVPNITHFADTPFPLSVAKSLTNVVRDHEKHGGFTGQAMRKEQRGNAPKEPHTHLDNFLNHLCEKEATFPSTEAAEAIKNTIEVMYEGLCRDLEANFLMFRGCTLLKTGSVYEGLKIGPPDEYDYMVSLPYLCDNEIFSFYGSQIDIEPQVIRLKLENADVFQDILAIGDEQENELSMPDGQATEDMDGDETVKDVQENFIIKVMNILTTWIKKCLRKHLPKEWELVSVGGDSNRTTVLPKISTAAVFNCAKCDKYNSFEISVDLSFALPMRKQPIWERGGLYLRSETVELKPSDEEYYVLIRDGKSGRISFSVDEQTIMNRFCLSDMQNKCLRAVKYLRNIYSTHVYDDDLNEMKPLISTYWLKTIMYYKYTDATIDWNSISLGEAVLGVLQTLVKCLEKKRLTSYFVPGYNLLSKSIAVVTSSKLDISLSDVTLLLDLLQNLSVGDSTALEELKMLQEKNCNLFAKLLYSSRKEKLLFYLYTYAYNDYCSEGLDTITKYCKRYLYPDVEIQGSGRSLQLKVQGKIIDIDREIESLYGEPVDYFGIK